MTFSDEIPEDLESAINRIGVEGLAIAGHPGAAVLFYAEVQADMDHMIFRYASPGEDVLHCAEESDDLVDAVRDAWKICDRAGKRWRAIAYVIKNQQIKVELLYDGQVSDTITMFEKEDELLAKHFSGMEVVPVEVPGAVPLTLSAHRPFWRFWR